MSAARKRRSNKFTAQNTLGQKEVDLEVYFGREQVMPQQVPPVGRALRVPGAHAPRAAAHAFRRVSTALAKTTKSSRMRSSSATGLLSSLTASFLRTGRLQLRCRVVSKPPELSTADFSRASRGLRRPQVARRDTMKKQARTIRQQRKARQHGDQLLPQNPGSGTGTPQKSVKTTATGEKMQDTAAQPQGFLGKASKRNVGQRKAGVLTGEADTVHSDSEESGTAGTPVLRDIDFTPTRKFGLGGHENRKDAASTAAEDARAADVGSIEDNPLDGLEVQAGSSANGTQQSRQGRRFAPLQHHKSSKNVLVDDQGRAIVVDSEGNVVVPDELGLMATFDDNGNRHVYMYDIDGNLVPVLLDKHENPKLDTGGKPLSGWVLDEDGRVAFTSDDNTIDVFLNEDENAAALLVDSAGSPTIAVLDVSGKVVPGPRIPPGFSTASAGMNAIIRRASDGRLHIVDGVEVEVETVTGSDGEQVIRDADGNEIAAEQDEDGKIALNSDAPSEAVLRKAASKRTETRMLNGVEVPVTIVVGPDGKEITVMKDSDGNNMAVSLDENGEIVLGDDGSPLRILSRNVGGVEVPVEILTGKDGQKVAIIKDANGNDVAVMVDENGEIVMGKDGKPAVAKRIPNSLKAEVGARGIRGSGRPDKLSATKIRTKDGKELEVVTDKDGNLVMMGDRPVAILREKDGGKILVNAEGTTVMLGLDEA